MNANRFVQSAVSILALSVCTSWALARPDQAPPELPRQLTEGPGSAYTTYNFHRNLAADSQGRLHLAYYRKDGDASQVLYRCSTTEGVAWSPELVLSQVPTTGHPSIAVDGPDVYVTYFAEDGLVRLRHSTDGGSSFAPAQVLATGTHPTVATNGQGTVHLVWMTHLDGAPEVHTRFSPNRGHDWSPPISLSELDGLESYVTTITASGPFVSACWVDTRDGNEEEYVRTSRDGGLNWSPVVRLTQDDRNSWAPSAVQNGPQLHVFYFDQTDAPLHPYEAEATLDEALRLLGLPVETPRPGVWLVNTLEDVQRSAGRKMERVLAAAPEYVASGGDVAALQQLQHELVLLEEEPAYSAEGILDEVLMLFGASPERAPRGTGMQAVQERIRLKLEAIASTAPEWVANGGDPAAPQGLLTQFERTARNLGAAYHQKELRIDQMLLLLGLPLEPARPVGQREFYQDVQSRRATEKLASARQGLQEWVAQGGDPTQIEALINAGIAQLQQATEEWEVYYRFSPDGGDTFQPAVRITQAPGSSQRPIVVREEARLQVVWFDRRDGNFEVYTKHSLDLGASWSPDTRLTSTANDSVRPHVVLTTNYVHVVWEEITANGSQVFYRRVPRQAD